MAFIRANTRGRRNYLPRTVETIAETLAPSYSGGMIPEFHELSDKIAALAEMTQALRRENAQLRHANAALGAENAVYLERLAEAHSRVEALLVSIPALVEDAFIGDTAADPVKEEEGR